MKMMKKQTAGLSTFSWFVNALDFRFRAVTLLLPLALLSLCFTVSAIRI